MSYLHASHINFTAMLESRTSLEKQLGTQSPRFHSLSESLSGKHESFKAILQK